MFIFIKCSDLKNVQIKKCSFSKNVLTQNKFIFEKCSNSNNQKKGTEKRNRKKGKNNLKKKVLPDLIGPQPNRLIWTCGGVRRPVRAVQIGV
jgi:hypothetical protein